MSTTDSSAAPLATLRRTTTSLAVAILLGLLGLPLLAGGVYLIASGSNPSNGVAAIVFSLAFNLPIVFLVRNYLRRRREREVVRIYPDRLERATSAGVITLPFDSLERMEAKIVRHTNTGSLFHSYRLMFARHGAVTLETVTHDGVDGDTGRLLQRVTGQPLQGWN